MCHLPIAPWIQGPAVQGEREIKTPSLLAEKASYLRPEKNGTFAHTLSLIWSNLASLNYKWVFREELEHFSKSTYGCASTKKPTCLEIIPCTKETEGKLKFFGTMHEKKKTSVE